GLRRVLAPGGRLLLSGILEEQVATLPVQGEVRLRAGWAAVMTQCSAKGTQPPL
ncbi:MAG: hypothetical protein IT162_20040, partial [Bryobacterales bacterium]|nr:hypothetical protein [Bryobacterales bacterium]